MFILLRSQLVLTCAIGYPPPPPAAAAAQAPQDQATPLSLLVTSAACLRFYLVLLSFATTVCKSAAPVRAVLRLPLPREGNHRRSGEPLHAARSAPLPCCPCPHSSPPNQCLPTDTTSEQAPLSASPLSIGAAAEKKTGGRRTERQNSAESLRSSYCPVRKPSEGRRKQRAPPRIKA